MEVTKRIAGVESKKVPLKKVTIVGVGAVGMAAAYAIACKELANVIVLVDAMTDKVKGEVMDLVHGKQFMRNCEVIGGSDYCVSAHSDIIVITAGARQREGESRLSLVQRNVDIYKQIIPEVARYSPNGIIVVVSNPVDILTMVAVRLSRFPPNRVIGTGCMLDSARFRCLLGEKLGLSPIAVHAAIIGEHGDSSVPMWSSVSVAGVKLRDINPQVGTDNDPELLGTLHRDVVQSAYEIIKLKGYTSWAIGLTCSALVSSILNNGKSIYPLTVNANGMYGITEDVYLSLPCLVGASGVTAVVTPELSCDERTKLLECAASLLGVIKSIQW